MTTEERNANRATLIKLLECIERCDTQDDMYDTRYTLVLGALSQANILGYPAGVRIDPDEPEWPVAFIELPLGQVSWHIPQHPIPWDGHTTATKYARCRFYRDSSPI